ncbi:serine/threonine-protein kinase [Streptomyces viridochromogenes]|uniref:serine/threonine-protein kinase n=1 Tax=Streptomyces viridochromogenes TaxID=1938 RepID=UPI00069DDFC7|nr:serine/threonine-protein kinase [Streptomyces viridochromogenes]KOG21249.1 serine/threonine protein kinase [Streptomyces viridochromogenes]KOG22936.1 serine/threonine protein kinase [Streptomyces viridochromogenes]
MGEVFAGRYELVDPIGRGGVGAVWRAWDHRRRRYVAAKVLQQSDAHSLLRFVREQALRIDHPHVLAPASWAADDDKVLFTMDLVAGGSLVHLVGDYGPLPPSFVCTLLDQLLSGLAAVHAEGVVHRDIKPANLLLEATGTGRPRLRLSDFGIAMRLGEPRLTETNLVVGTPGYLAPEQLMGAEPDFPADLFAVGLVALYLLEGAKPDVKALVQYFAEHGTPSAPTGIPEPLWQVVASLLQPDPQARFRTATGARKALASAAELLPEPGPDDELIEIFDQIGPLPTGFEAGGPLKRAPGVEGDTGGLRQSGTGSGPGSGPAGSVNSGSWPMGTGSMAPDTGSGATGTDSAPRGTTPSDPRQGVATPAPASEESSVPSRSGPKDGPLSMSDTGSFHLPPPPTAFSPQTQTPPPQPHPAHVQAQAHVQNQPQGQGQGQTGQAHQGAQHRSPHTSPYDTTHVLASPQPRAPQYPTQPPTPVQHQRVDASTASYTAQSPQVPPSAPSIAQPHRRGGHRAARRRAHGLARRRPGPPAKVAVPLLLLALACYAVGFWALTRI